MELDHDRDNVYHDTYPDEGEVAPEDERDDRDIQTLLDVGYEQLDGFTAWLEESMGVDTRTAQQDCFNAESLIDYLANYPRKEAMDVDEFDLRWFVFNHYIRKAMADSETELRLPDSLLRFFTYLSSEHGYAVPDWLYGVLEDRAFYVKRRQEYLDLDMQDEAQWQEGFRAWNTEMESDLDTRCLWLPIELGEGLAWGERMGWTEGALQMEANRLWQEERTELLQEGMDYESARTRLLASYGLWLDTPQARLEDLSPREAILAERREQAENEEEEAIDPD